MLAKMNELDVEDVSSELPVPSTDADAVPGDGIGLSDDQFAIVQQHLASIDYTNGALLASVNLGFVVLAAALIFIVFWKIFDIAFGR